MEHLTFKGTAALPVDPGDHARPSRASAGRANAATDRESTVYWVRVPRREAAVAMDVLGELIVRPTPRRCRHRPRAHGHRRGDPLLPRRPVGVRPDPDPAGDVRGRAARPRDLRRRGGDPGPARRRRSATSGRRATGRRTPSSRWPVTSTTTRPSSWSRRPSAPATARSRRSPAAPSLPAGARFLVGKRDTSQASARDRACRGCRATIPTPGTCPCSTRSSATGCPAGCSSVSGRRRGSPTT